MPDAKTNSQRHRAIDGLVKANLGNGRLSIELRTKTDMKYTAGRSVHDAVQVLNEMGTAVLISLDRDQMFGADVFSQNEIEEIASSPAAQLQLLDRFEENETISIDRELEMLQRQLDQSSIDLRQIDQAAEDALGRASELPVLEEKLKGRSCRSGRHSNQCDTCREELAYAHSTNSSNSVWMPWELGDFDGIKPQQVWALLLVTNDDSEFKGQEYLGLYPPVEKLSIIAGRTRLGFDRVGDDNHQVLLENAARGHGVFLVSRN
jgi:hypothetical protein